MKVFHCQHCGQMVYFANTRCERCGNHLGYLPDLEVLSADGDVESYTLTVYDRWFVKRYSGQPTTQTSYEFNASKLNPGEIYTVRVDAKPVGGEDGATVWAIGFSDST